MKNNDRDVLLLLSLGEREAYVDAVAALIGVDDSSSQSATIQCLHVPGFESHFKACCFWKVAHAIKGSGKKHLKKMTGHKF